MTTTTKTKIQTWYWAVTALLILWELMGCFACIQQIRLGPAAMGQVDDWSIQYYASLPIWYNGVYAVATFAALLGGVSLLLRKRLASAFYWISFIAIIVMFGYSFAATDLIAHKGMVQVLPFPLLIAGIGAFSIWFAKQSARKGWIGA